MPKMISTGSSELKWGSANFRFSRCNHLGSKFPHLGTYKVTWLRINADYCNEELEFMRDCMINLTLPLLTDLKSPAPRIGIDRLVHSHRICWTSDSDTSVTWEPGSINALAIENRLDNDLTFTTAVLRRTISSSPMPALRAATWFKCGGGWVTADSVWLDWVTAWECWLASSGFLSASWISVTRVTGQAGFLISAILGWMLSQAVEA